MRIVFIGSAPLACVALQALVAGRSAFGDPEDDYASPHDDIVTVVTQPDRPRGRNLETAACPSKVLAEDVGIPVLTPDNINSDESVGTLGALKPDVIVVVAYGQILKERVLSLPRHGCINLHASLLPRYRGAAPIQWAIANGDEVTGVTTIFMDEGMDSGDIIMQKEVPISHVDTGGSLHDKLARAGTVLLMDTLDAVRSGTFHRTRQDGKQATLAPKLKKDDGRIDWAASSDEIYNRIRAFNPRPGSFCMVKSDERKSVESRLKVLDARIEGRMVGYEGTPGQLLDVAADGPLIRTGGASPLRLIRVQPAGGKAMSGPDYVRGRSLSVGDVLT